MCELKGAWSSVHRMGGAPPDGAAAIGRKLVFGRPIRMNDSGEYECVVKNKVGVVKADYVLPVKGRITTSSQCIMGTSSSVFYHSNFLCLTLVQTSGDFKT